MGLAGVHCSLAEEVGLVGVQLDHQTLKLSESFNRHTLDQMRRAQEGGNYLKLSGVHKSKRHARFMCGLTSPPIGLPLYPDQPA